jgi:hypothetical protein
MSLSIEFKQKTVLFIGGSCIDNEPTVCFNTDRVIKFLPGITINLTKNKNINFFIIWEVGKKLIGVAFGPGYKDLDGFKSIFRVIFTKKIVVFIHKKPFCD